MTTIADHTFAAADKRMTDITVVVAMAYQVSVPDIRGRRKFQHLAEVRSVAMWLLRQSGYTQQQVGDYLGRHHTTVLYGARKVRARIEADAEFARLAAELKRKADSHDRGSEQRV